MYPSYSSPLSHQPQKNEKWKWPCSLKNWQHPPQDNTSVVSSLCNLSTQPHSNAPAQTTTGVVVTWLPSFFHIKNQSISPHSIRYPLLSPTSMVTSCKGSDVCKYMYIKMNKKQQRNIPTYLWAAAQFYSTYAASYCTYPCCSSQPLHMAWPKPSSHPAMQIGSVPHPQMPVHDERVPLHFQDQPQGRQYNPRWHRQSWRFVCNKRLGWHELWWRGRIGIHRVFVSLRGIWCSDQ